MVIQPLKWLVRKSGAKHVFVRTGIVSIVNAVCAIAVICSLPMLKDEFPDFAACKDLFGTVQGYVMDYFGGIEPTASVPPNSPNTSRAASTPNVTNTPPMK